MPLHMDEVLLSSTGCVLPRPTLVTDDDFVSEARHEVHSIASGFINHATSEILLTSVEKDTETDVTGQVCPNENAIGWFGIRIVDVIH